MFSVQDMSARKTYNPNFLQNSHHYTYQHNTHMVWIEKWHQFDPVFVSLLASLSPFYLCACTGLHAQSHSVEITDPVLLI